MRVGAPNKRISDYCKTLQKKGLTLPPIIFYNNLPSSLTPPSITGAAPHSPFKKDIKSMSRELLERENHQKNLMTVSPPEP
jgi:hypothetical protein